MKINLFKYFSLLVCCFGLNGCGYLISFGQLMFDDTCSNWNCTHSDANPPKGDVCVTRELKDEYRLLSYQNSEKIRKMIVDGCRENQDYILKEDPKYIELRKEILKEI